VSDLTVLIGGARAGKSALALKLAGNWGGDVAYVATAEAGDDEMADRIARHRSERPKTWATIEAPLELRRAVAKLDGLVIVDCLTLWVANLIARGDDEDSVVAEAVAVADAAARREAPTIVVTNEVGLGIVPQTESGREYRDVLGAVNRVFVDRSSRAAFVVAGRPLPLETAAWPGIHD
jgi:adenosylcobinamide kinase / adenosylcobinamide-phosphate guanylyltransferase